MRSGVGFLSMFCTAILFLASGNAFAQVYGGQVDEKGQDISPTRTSNEVCGLVEQVENKEEQNAPVMTITFRATPSSQQKRYMKIFVANPDEQERDTGSSLNWLLNALALKKRTYFTKYSVGLHLAQTLKGTKSKLCIRFLPNSGEVDEIVSWDFSRRHPAL